MKPGLALFFSGTGGNALNLLHACRQGFIPAEPRLGLSSKASALGVQRLTSAGLTVLVHERSTYPSDQAFSEACFLEAEKAQAPIVCLCGWLKKLVIPSEWAGRVLNIHPGLLPRFGGVGMYGHHVHRAALASGLPESGCTVHLVDNEYDHGPILGETHVPILPGDTPETLQARVYAEEMKLYPKVLVEFLAKFHHMG